MNTQSVIDLEQHSETVPPRSGSYLSTTNRYLSEVINGMEVGDHYSDKTLLMMPRWGEIDFSEYNIVVYNLRLISYLPDKLVAILLYLHAHYWSGAEMAIFLLRLFSPTGILWDSFSGAPCSHLTEKEPGIVTTTKTLTDLLNKHTD